MTVSAAQAAKYIGSLSGWKLSNLSIQKLLYITHMVFLGENGGRPLVRESFEAWDYGPVVPQVYHRVKMFGNTPIKDVFYNESPLDPTTPEASTISRAVEAFADLPASELVSITHWPLGAWATHYKQGVHGIKIPNADILKEFRARFPEKLG